MSTPMVARVFLAHQINTLVEFYDMTIITNLDGNKLILDNISSKVNIIDLPIKRDVNLFADLRALLVLIGIIYKNRFSLVHSVSPKAGLLTSIASSLNRTENRLHTFTGQVWVTKKGIKRWFLKMLDKVIVLLNTNILIDSFSQQKFLINESVVTKKSSIVLGKGSISGVDINHFIPSRKYRNSIRKRLKINDDFLIFLYVGRIKKEKGIFELIKAFKNISIDHDNLALLIVGPDEENLKQELIEYSGFSKKFIKFVDFTKTPEQYMAASDIFVLPSYREGFGSVVIEAAACGLPSIGSDIYGLSDAINEEETGLLVPARSCMLLEKAMLKLVNNNELRYKMGLNARNRVISQFSQDKITLNILQLYKRLLK
ncbi:glycosyltransferase family 4 protein [Alphaproteobacteria bacterium]|nr:glycosyltransferase family 4 protein [Alphaproteobacteria bacterium]